MVVELRESAHLSRQDMSPSSCSRDRYERQGSHESLGGRPHSSDMQNKPSDVWTNPYGPDYPTKQEDGTLHSVQDTGRQPSPGSVVSSLLRKTSGHRDSLRGEAGVRRDQRSPEMGVEKDLPDTVKCSSSVHSDQDSPIDFSVKRRSSFSGSLTDDSRTSMGSPGNITDYNVLSPSEDADYSQQYQHFNDTRKRSSASPRYQDTQHFNQLDDVKPTVLPPPLINGLDMFCGLSSNILTTGTPAFSRMAAAAFMNPDSKKSNNRPFKAYPKEALQMPLGFLGVTGLAHSPASADPGAQSGVNGEDLLSIYTQHLQLLQDNQPTGADADGTTSPLCNIPASSKNSRMLPKEPRGYSRNQHQPQNNHRYTERSRRLSRSPPSSSTIPAAPHSPSSSSPISLLTPDQLSSSPPTPSSKYSSTAITTGPISVSSHVTSTSSSYSLSGSRKRPRSLPDNQKDAAYWERRRKNNDAAKRSRDARRAKEDEIAIRAALLEQENIKLRVEVAALKTETARLRCLLYNS